jgi:hypothetical protein
MAGDLREFLSRLPAIMRIDQTACEFLDKEIRAGADLNQLQRENLMRIVQHAVEQNMLPPSPYESFLAYVYLEWSDEAKRSEDVKPRLIELVKRLKATPPLAGAVNQLAQQVAQEREGRRKRDIEKLAAAVGGPTTQETANTRRGGAGADPPNILVKRMQAARHGGGDNGMANLDLAAQYADEAVEAYPNYPKILFEAAGCHQLASEKGTHLSLTDRYVHMKQAYSLYQQCLTILAGEPYVKLKGEYDVWRKGITELIPRVQQKLAYLEEKQQ